jgi:hypothetical protein
MMDFSFLWFMFEAPTETAENAVPPRQTPLPRRPLAPSYMPLPGASERLRQD